MSRIRKDCIRAVTFALFYAPPPRPSTPTLDALRRAVQKGH